MGVDDSKEEKIPELIIENITDHEYDNRIIFSNKVKLMYVGSFILIVIMIFLSVSIYNPGLYKINEETLIVINKAFNALVYLTIPFIIGITGAISRVLISGINVINQLSLIISSGLLAAFSWVGIKSGVLLAIVAPHLELQGVKPEVVVSSPSDFYTMVLVAILVGMFSTNLYLLVNQKIESLTKVSGKDILNK